MFWKIPGKNEVTVEFHRSDDASISLMEMRFFVPADQEGSVDTVKVRTNSKILFLMFSLGLSSFLVQLYPVVPNFFFLGFRKIQIWFGF